MLAEFKELLPLLQISVGGFVAIVILKLVFEYLLKTRNGNGNGNGSSRLAKSEAQTPIGEQPTAFWQLELRRAMSETVGQSVVPILEQQTKILDKLLNVQESIVGEIRDAQTSTHSLQVETSSTLKALISEIRIARATRGASAGSIS